MKFSINTSRLILRQFDNNDVDNIYALDTNKMVLKYLPNKPLKTRDDALKSVRFIKEQYVQRGIARWAAIEKATGNFIGWSGLKLNTEEPINGFTDFYDIGYRLLPEFWGKGYATESSMAALEYGFNILNLETIYGITHIENEASHKVLLKIGLIEVNKFYFKPEKLYLRWYELDKKSYEKRMSGMR